MSGCESTEITKSFGQIKNRYLTRLSKVFNYIQRIVRVSNDFCAVSNTCDADTTCANGITESTCNCDVQDAQMCRQYMSSTDQSWPDMNFDDARVKCFAEGGRLLRITSSLDLLNLDLASSFDQDQF